MLSERTTEPPLPLKMPQHTRLMLNSTFPLKKTLRLPSSSSVECVVVWREKDEDAGWNFLHEHLVECLHFTYETERNINSLYAIDRWINLEVSFNHLPKLNYVLRSHLDTRLIWIWYTRSSPTSENDNQEKYFGIWSESKFHKQQYIFRWPNQVIPYYPKFISTMRP